MNRKVYIVKNFIMFCLFLNDGLLISLSVYNYTNSMINKHLAQGKQWQTCIVLSLIYLGLLLIYLFASRKRHPKRKRVK